MIQYVKQTIKAQKKLVIFYILVSIVILLLELFVPYVSGYYIDSLVEKHSKIVIFISGIALLNLFSFLMEYTMTLLSTKLNNVFLYELCNMIFQNIYSKSLSFLQGKDLVALTDQVTGDAETITSFSLSTILDVLYDVIVMIVCVVILFRVDILLGSCMVISIPIYFFIYKILECRLYENEKQFKEASNDYTAKGIEQIYHTRFVKQNSLAKEMEERFSTSFQKMLQIAIKQVKTEYFFSNLNGMIMVFCYIVALGIGGYKVEQGMISIGYFTMIQTYLNMVLSSVFELIDFSGQIPKVKVAFDRMNYILTYNSLEQKDKKNHFYDLEEIQKITIENLSFSFQNKRILEELSIKFERGKLYGIIGENGSGKSTLFDVIMGLYEDEYKGSIFYNNQNIKNLNMEKIIKEQVAFLGQQIDRISLLGKEYIRFGVQESEEREDEFYHYLQKKITGKKEEIITKCSGGEFQALSLMRILQKKYSVVLLDEPTTGLDKETVRHLVKWIDKEKKHKIILVISHDRRILERCDEILKIEKLVGENDERMDTNL